MGGWGERSWDMSSNKISDTVLLEEVIFEVNGDIYIYMVIDLYLWEFQVPAE